MWNIAVGNGKRNDMTTYLIILGGLVLLVLIVRHVVRIRRAGRAMSAIETAGKVVRGAVFARLANRYRQTYGPEAKALAAAVANVLFSEPTPHPSPAWDFIESHPGIVEEEVKALKADEALLGVVHAILSHEIGVSYARGVDAHLIEASFKRLEELGLLVPTQMQLEECVATARRFMDEQMERESAPDDADSAAAGNAEEHEDASNPAPPDTAGSSPGRRNAWRAIALKLLKQLEHTRESWFDSSITMLRKTSAKEGLVHTELGGQADLAIKAYQLYLVSSFVCAHAYVSRQDAQEFMGLLYPLAWGAQEEACLPFYRRYIARGKTEQERTSLCVRDVAEYVVDANLEDLEKMDASMSLCATGTFNFFCPIFLHYTHLAVAVAFEDHKTADELLSLAQRLTGKLKQ